MRNDCFAVEYFSIFIASLPLDCDCCFRYYSTFEKFLLILWEFHIIHQDHTHFPFLPSLLPTLVSSYSPPKIKIKNKTNLCYLYRHWSMIKFSVAFHLSRTKLFPSHTPARRHQMWRANQHPYHTF